MSPSRGSQPGITWVSHSEPSGQGTPGTGASPFCAQLPFEIGCKDRVGSRERGSEVVTGFLYNKLAKHFGFITLLAVVDILISGFIA